MVLTKQQQLKSGQALLPCATLRGAGGELACRQHCDWTPRGAGANISPQLQPSQGAQQGLFGSARQKAIYMITLVGEDRLGQRGGAGSHGGRGAAGSDTGSSWEPAILTDLGGVLESARERKEGSGRTEL